MYLYVCYVYVSVCVCVCVLCTNFVIFWYYVKLLNYIGAKYQRGIVITLSFEFLGIFCIVFKVFYYANAQDAVIFELIMSNYFPSPPSKIFFLLQSICLLECHLIARQQYLQFVLRLYSNHNRSVGNCERQRKPRYQIPQGFKRNNLDVQRTHAQAHERFDGQIKVVYNT